MQWGTAALTVSAALAAQGAGERALLIVDPTHADALHVANHYAAMRELPGCNVLYMDPDAATYGALAGAQLEAFLGELEQRGLRGSVDFVVLAPSDSFFVPAVGLLSDGCSPVRRFALPSAYGLHESQGLVLGGTNASVLQPNRYFRGNWDAAGFRSEVRWSNGLPSTGPTAQSYYIPASLGWIGERGNTKGEVLAMIDRSVLADATAPTGTAYYMQTTDAARSAPRHGLYPAAVSQMALAGGLAQHLMAVLPLGMHDALGIMTGWASPDIDGGVFTLSPGSFADHLTSYAATFDVSAQVKMSRWIAKGASGTAGTVEEPCNYASKFPHALLHVVYRRGLALGEAWFRSMGSAPFQSLFIGDPLTTPWSFAPTVQVTGLPGGPVAGTLTLTPTATPHPLGGLLIQELELFVDGVRVARGALGTSFVLDTLGLADGWHDLGVRATDASPERHHATWRARVEVSNLGRSVTCAPSASSVALSEAFDLTLTAAGGDVDEVVVLQGARIVASLPSGNGSGNGVVRLHGRSLGAGSVRLVAEARFADGGRARSAEVLLDVLDAELPPLGSTPVAFGYRRSLRTNAPCVLDLPATFESALGTATFAVVDAPDQATVLGGAGPTLLLAPNAGAHGVDLVRFEVTTPAGTTDAAIVQLVYAAGQQEARLVCTALPNSVGRGARIGWRGSASVAADDLELTFAGAPAGVFGVVFHGQGLTRVPLGNGLLCVGAQLVRLAVVQAGPSGSLSIAPHLATSPFPGAAVAPGDTRTFQLWYRDIGGAAFNLSDGLEVTFGP